MQRAADCAAKVNEIATRSAVHDRE
jgi:hypothetical protein